MAEPRSRGGRTKIKKIGTGRRAGGSSQTAGADRFGPLFYERYYRDRRSRVVTPAEMRRRAELIAAFARHGELRVRRILDAGCGLGLMRGPLLGAFPRARYTGLELSPYLCERYG